MDEDHLEVVGEGGQHGSVSFKVDVSDGDGAVTQEAELSLNVELLQQEEAVRRHLHDPLCNTNNQSGVTHRAQNTFQQVEGLTLKLKQKQVLQRRLSLVSKLISGGFFRRDIRDNDIHRKWKSH